MKHITSNLHNPLEESHKYYNNKFYFEQNELNKDKKKFNYFNQECIEVPIYKGNIEQIINEMYLSIKEYGTGLSHNQYPKEQSSTNPYAIFIIKTGINTITQTSNYDIFINPVIVGYSKEIFPQYYSSLSDLSYARIKTPYYKEIIIVFYNKNFELEIKKYSDIEAARIQDQFMLLTTQGTYIDILFNSCSEYEKSLNSIDEKVFHLDYDNLPTIIPDYLLSRCKKYILEHPLYFGICHQYLKNNINDNELFSNLMSLTYEKEQESLYGKCSCIDYPD